MCELLTQAHLRSEKGKCAVQWNELAQFAKGLIALFNELRLQTVGRLVRRKILQRFTEWSSATPAAWTAG